MSFVSFADDLLRRRARRTGGVITLEQVNSTQLLGRRIIDEYTREGSLPPAADVIAWRQTTGKGRQGRAWSSPPGHGVYATLIRPVASSSLQHLPLQVAVALAEVLNRHLDGRCRLKWPNDLLVGEAKLGGLLIEAVSQEGASEVAIALGIGINYSPDLQAFGEPRATSLHHEMARPAPSLAELASDVLDAVDAVLAEPAPPSETITVYERLMIHEKGDPIRCRLADEVVEGRFLGFNEYGFLRLDVGAEDLVERLLSSGEILGE